MAPTPFPSTNLTHPVSLLWAHQLRREHAAIVIQLGEIKALHPSASELKKLVSRTEKAEAAITKLRKEIAELKRAQGKIGKVVGSFEKDVLGLKEKEKEREGNEVVGRETEEGVRVEIERLNEVVMRQESGLAGMVDEVQRVEERVQKGSAAMEERHRQRHAEEMAELRSMVLVLGQKVRGNAGPVTVVEDSVQALRTVKGRFSLLSRLVDSIKIMSD